MFNEFINVKGQVNMVLTGPNGEIKEKRAFPNLVVTVGKNWIAGRMKDVGIPVQMTHMGIGAGTVDPNVVDTALGSALGARVALSTAGGVVSSNTVTYDCTFAPGAGTGAVTEAGIFNAISAGTMLCRTEFPVVNKAAEDTLSVQWIVTIS